jgi:transcriptional regulator with XRE-family HTH domain
MEINPAQRAGKILRMMREEAGLTQAELAKVALSSATMVSYVESGTKAAKPDLLARIGEALDGRVQNVKDILIEVWGFTTSGGYSAAFEMLASQEADASKIHIWDNRVFPGLLQTPGYAKAVMRAARPRGSIEAIDHDVADRIGRQVILTREDPPIAWFVLDEGVLCRSYGGQEVMNEQLAKLEALADQPNVTVQVMPFSAVDHPGLEGPLRIIEFPDKSPAMYNESWSAGKMTEAKDEVSAAMASFDLIRASAMSPAESAKFIASKRFAE